MRKSAACAAADAANGVMCLLVAVYGAFVLVLMRGQAIPMPAFLALCAGGLALCLLLSRMRGDAGPAFLKTPGPLSRRVFFAGAALSMLVSLIYLFAFFPGGFSSDTVTQWHQLRGELALSDWHPALHTMLLWLLTRICEHPAFVLIIQGAAYACAVGYAAAALDRRRVPKTAAAIAVLYLAANPAVSNIMAFPWKDCAFAIAALFLGVQLFEIHASGGEWLRGRGRPFLLALTLALSAILRHNGVALSLAAAVWLLISLPGLKKRAAASLLIAAALFAFIKGPLYGAAGVQKSATPLDETIGLPMTILSHVYVSDPQALDGETVAFLEMMGPRETYAAHHRPGDFNETKWHLSPLPEDHGYTLVQVFSFAAKAAAARPSLAIEALSGLFSMPLLPAGEAYWRMSPYVDASAAQFGIERAHHPFLSRALNWLCRLSASPALSFLFWRPGVPLLLVMLACVRFARRRRLSALLLPAAIICYHLATSVMLTSPTDLRFFLPTMLLAPLALCALFMRDGGNSPSA